jgi:hypothetical protein
MSNTLTVRQYIRDWLESKIRIDKWDSDSPKQLFADQTQRFPANTAIELPMVDRDANAIHHNDGGIYLTYTATLPYVIVYRLPGLLSQDDIELTKYESLLEFMTGTALGEWKHSKGITHVEFLDDEYTIQIARSEEHQKDWLVYVNFTPRVTYDITEFNLAPEFGDFDNTPDTPISQVEIGVFRDYTDSLGSLPHSLDNTIILTPED